MLGIVRELVDPSECCFSVKELPEDLFAGFAVDACVGAIVWGEMGVARALNTSHWLMRHTPHADVSTIALDGAIKTCSTSTQQDSFVLRSMTVQRSFSQSYDWTTQKQSFNKT